MLKVYVAAKFSDKKRVDQCYNVLKASGYTITHEWIHNKQAIPFHQYPEFTRQCAWEDINGVRAADIFILLSHSEPSMGASAELGAAIATYLMYQKPLIFVVGPYFDANFCFWHPAVTQKNSIEEVLLQIAHNKKIDDIDTSMVL